MGEIVNLRRARKRKTRQDASAAADEARARSGLSKLERESARRLRDKADSHLDGHLLPGAPDDSRP